MKRLFLGIPLSEEVRNKAMPVLKEISAVHGDFSFVSVKNLHITVKFLGDVEEKEISLIAEKMSSVVRKYVPFSAQFHGVGAFPRLERISVIWMGVQCPELPPLLKEIHDALNYIRKEEREDIPHVTLVRVKSGRKQGKLQYLFQKVQHLLFGKMMIDRIVLYESLLRPEGPLYVPLQEFRLGAE